MPRLLATLACLLAPAQDDRATILEGVETWYQVVQDGKNKGYVHEKLERVKDEWTYAYRFDAELAVKDGWHLEYRDVEATLDEDLGVLSLSATLEAGKEKAEFTITADGGRRTLALPVEGKPERRESVASDAHPFPTLLFYSLRRGGRLAKAGPCAARVIAPRPEGRVDSEVSFEIGAFVTREVLGKSRPVSPVTFLKSPPASRPEMEWATALVDKFGRLTEVTLRGGAKLVMVEGPRAAFRDAVNVHRSELREPFRKDEAMRAAKRESTPPPAEPRRPKVDADNLESTLAEAEHKLEALRALAETGGFEATPPAYHEILGLWKAIRAKADELGRADLVAKADHLRDRLEGAWDGAARTLASALRLSDRIERDLGRSDLPALERDLRALRDLRSIIELERRPEQTRVIRLIAQAEPLLGVARTRAELSKKAVAVTGTVLSNVEQAVSVELAAGVTENVRFVRDTSTAAINGKSYRVGETIEGAGVRLEKISRNGVTVSLRGELREIPVGGN